MRQRRGAMSADLPAYRIFIASPGDVPEERARALRVVQRLGGEFADQLHLAAIAWEQKTYGAHADFQAQIAATRDCHLVVGILWQRVGTPLDGQLYSRDDGTPFESGTVFEIETALNLRRGGTLPDVALFKKRAPPQQALSPEDVQQLAQDLPLLEAITRRWFRTESGAFKAAFNDFTTPESFEALLEQHLRAWLAERGHAAEGRAWRIETDGSPYPGLSPYEAGRERVFFGRDRARLAARLALSEAAARGCPFLLIVGGSGAGKSSLARAGLLPSLALPGSAPGVDGWCVATLRPGATPVSALAEAIFDALPAMAGGDAGTPGEWAATLLARPQSAAGAVARALERQGAGERRLRLLLLADQLEEAFDAPPAQRDAFCGALAALVQGGQWVVATLRADRYAALLDRPDLVALQAAGATQNLRPPDAEDIEAIIRGPARAAGLVFERRSDGRDLAQILQEEMDGADALPLLQMALARLFVERDRGTNRLTFAAHAGMGGLRGAIQARADAVFAKADAAAQGELPAVLLALAAGLSEAGLAIARPMAEAELATTDARRALLRVLVDGRLLVAERAASGAVQLRVAHEALLRNWPTATRILAPEHLRAKPRLEAALADWRDRGAKGRDLLRGTLLDAGLGLLRAHARALPAALADFIRRSHRAERLRRFGARGALVVFGVVALLAVGFALEALQQAERADLQAQAAETARAEAVREADRATTEQAIATAARAMAEEQRAQAVAQAARADRAAAETAAALRVAEQQRSQADAATALAQREADRATTEQGIATAARAVAEERRAQAVAEAARADRAAAETAAALRVAEQQRTQAQASTAQAQREATNARNAAIAAEEARVRAEEAVGTARRAQASEATARERADTEAGNARIAAAQAERARAAEALANRTAQAAARSEAGARRQAEQAAAEARAAAALAENRRTAALAFAGSLVRDTLRRMRSEPTIRHATVFSIIDGVEASLARLEIATPPEEVRQLRAEALFLRAEYLGFALRWDEAATARQAGMASVEEGLRHDRTAEWLRLRAHGHKLAADEAYARGHHHAAWAAREAAANDAAAAMALAPADNTLALGLVEARLMLALVARERGDLDLAARLLRDAMNALDRLEATHGNSAEYLSAKLSGTVLEANISSDRGRFSSFIQFYNNAERVTYLGRRNDNLNIVEFFQAINSVTEGTFLELIVEGGDGRNAYLYSIDAMELFSRMNLTARSHRLLGAEVDLRRASISTLEPNHGQANIYLISAIHSLRDLAAEVPTFDVRSTLADGLLQLSMNLLALDASAHGSQAIRHIDEALQILRSALDADPNNQINSISWIYAALTRADALRNTGKELEALQWLNNLRPFVGTWTANHVHNHHVIKAGVNLERRIASVAWARREPELARAAVRRALSLMDRLGSQSQEPIWLGIRSQLLREEALGHFVQVSRSEGLAMMRGALDLLSRFAAHPEASPPVRLSLPMHRMTFAEMLLEAGDARGRRDAPVEARAALAEWLALDNSIRGRSDLMTVPVRLQQRLSEVLAGVGDQAAASRERRAMETQMNDLRPRMSADEFAALQRELRPVRLRTAPPR
jgi:hypothetical protein